MNKTITIFFVLFLLLSFSSGCNSNQSNEKDSEELIDNSYFNKKFEWQLNISPNWRLTTSLEKEIFNQVGDKSIKDEFKKNSTNTWVEILNLQSPGALTGQLTASYSKYDKAIHGDSYKNSKETRFYGIQKLIENNKGVKVESFRGEIKIDNITFDVFDMSVKKNGEQKFYQTLLEKRYENDDILLINIFATELAKFNEFKDTLLVSKFNRKN